MSITCQICQASFPKIIPWQHLRTHNITSVEYKERHGALYSLDTLAKHAARVPHNKGKKVTDPAHKAKIKEAITQREERFRAGEIRRGKKWDAAHKELLSQRSKDYAAKNQAEMKARAQKAIATKIEKYGSMPAPFAGKKHSEAAKERIRAKSKETNAKKTVSVWQRITGLVKQYNLTLVSEVGQHPLRLQCNACHTNFEFTAQYFTPSKTFSEMCPTCYPRAISQSKAEQEIFMLVSAMCPDAVAGYRKTYHSFELDIFIPSKNIGIEYDGLYWHSEETLAMTGKSKFKSLHKKKHFESQGIQLITIMSDEWEERQDIVKSRLTSLLGKTVNRIYARQCVVQEISSTMAAAFCDQNHIMGKGRSNIRLGLFHRGELVSVMTFSKSNLSRKVVGWELNRFASKLNTSVVGGASKLFKHFVRNYSPDSVISYADNRWSTGGLYSTLGFNKESAGTPNYWYFKPPAANRIHRFTLRKNKTDDQALTEAENRRVQGYLRIWDCGSSKWVWTNKE